MPTLME